MFWIEISHQIEYNMSELHGQHRAYINLIINKNILLHIDKSMKILEDKFNLRNPFDNHP